MRNPLLLVCAFLLSVNTSVLAWQGPTTCTLDASFVSATPITCPGTTFSSVLITAIGGQGAVRFLPDGVEPGRTNGVFNNFFTGGNHFVIVRDAAGCADTVRFSVSVASSALSVRVQATDVRCNGDNTGSATAEVQGGSGPFAFTWQACGGGPILRGASLSGLSAGCYLVTVTDGNQCRVTDTARIREPLPFQFSFATDSVRCFGDRNGRATLTVTNGTSPFTIEWGSGETGPTAVQLRSGITPVTVTDANNCVQVTTTNVGGPSAYNIDSIGSKGITCVGKTDAYATAYVRGGNLPYTYLWNNQATTRSITNLNIGSYTVTVTDAKGCTLAQTVNVGTQPRKSILFQRRNERCPNECNGSVSVLVLGGSPPYTYLWQNPRLAGKQERIDSLCPGMYPLIVVDNVGCRDTSNVEILKADSMKVVFNATPPHCQGERNGQAQARIAGGFSPFQYTWSSNATTQTAANLACGVHTVTVRDAEGCTLRDSVRLECPPAFALVSVESRQTSCIGNVNGQITVHVRGGKPPYRYRWSDVNAQLDSVAVNLPPGRYTVTVTDAFDCTLAVTDSVRNPPPLLASFVVKNATCNGENLGGITLTVRGGNPAYQYNWSNASNKPSLDSVGAGTYSVSITDANGCTTTLTGMIVGQPATKVQIALDRNQQPCFGGTNGAITVTGSGSNGSPFRYAWSGGLVGPAQTNLAPGNYTVTVFDRLGCTSTREVPLPSLDSIALNVITEQPGCNGGRDGRAVVNLVKGGAGNGNTANYSFKWSIPGAADSVLVTGLQGGRVYHITATDRQGCMGSFTFLLQQPPPLSVEMKVKDVTCFNGADGEIAAKGISVHNIVAYAWNNEQTSTPAANLRVGVYTVTVTDAKGCTGSGSAEVKQPPPIEALFRIQSLLCHGDSNGVVQTIVRGGVPGYTYAWSNGEKGLNMSKLKAGNYLLTVTDKNGCKQVDTAIVQQPARIRIMPDIVEPTCSGYADGKLTLNIVNGKPPYQYSLLPNPYGSSPHFLGLRAGTYRVQVKDKDNCSVIDTIQFTQPPPVTVDLDTDLTVKLGDSVSLTATPQNTVGSVTYIWRSAILDSLRCTDVRNCETIIIFPKQKNTYTVEVVDSKGCRAKNFIVVDVEKNRGLFVPMAFTPNEDANNDRLLVHGSSHQIKHITVFQVYDRWGELLYEDRLFSPNDTGRGWDGSFRGQACAAGTYVWHAEVEYVDGYREAQSGQVLLIR